MPPTGILRLGRCKLENDKAEVMNGLHAGRVPHWLSVVEPLDNELRVSHRFHLRIEMNDCALAELRKAR